MYSVCTTLYTGGGYQSLARQHQMITPSLVPAELFFLPLLSASSFPDVGVADHSHWPHCFHSLFLDVRYVLHY